MLFSLTLVRHGETEANRNCVVQGHTDYPLNDNGRNQARLLGKSYGLSQTVFSHCFSSDLARTSETARLIVDNLTDPNVNIVLDRRLRERCFGSFESLPSCELHAAARAANKKILDFHPDGSESTEQVRERVVGFFRDLCRKLHFEFCCRANSASDNEGIFKSNSAGILMSRQSSRKVSRSGNLSTWLEETDSQNGNKAESADFYIADDSNSRDDFVAKRIQESYDSGIAEDVAPLTVDIEMSSSPPSGVISSVRSSASSTGGWSTLGLSPRGAPSSQSPLPLVGSSRKFSLQSIASDDSFFPELDAQVLVVTHGGPIKEFLRYFCDDLGCTMPGGKGAALSMCPNTSASTFMVSFDGEKTNLTCLELHAKDHLTEAPCHAESSIQF